MEERRVFSTHLRRCQCGGALAKAHEIEATLYSMTGYETVLVRTFRCTTYSCRRTFGPNFAWDASSKINTASPLDLKNMEALFVNSKVGFSLSFLEYHALMEFRACLSARAVEYVYQHTFGLNTAGNMSNRWRLSYSSAIMYYVAIHELAPLHLHMKIVLGNEISSDILAKYEQHVLGHVLPAKNRTKVSEVVCDGHAKVHVKCASARNHAGKPRAGGKKKPYGHGWFMVVNPSDKRILWAKPMHVPEGNDILEDAITSILPSYKNMNCVIVDRACSFYPSALKQKRLKQIKFWVVDKFHSHGHTKSCPCNPLHHVRLSRRVDKINTSAAEGVFSWFRNFARILNEATPERHAFKVLYFCKLHNIAVERRKTEYLPRIGANRKNKKRSKPYTCGNGLKKRPAAKCARKKPASRQ